MEHDDHVPSERWLLAGTSTIGATHVLRGLPCQDAFFLEAPSGPDEPAVVAVADGHGARRHFRSETGAALAVEVACDVALRHALRLAELTSRAEVRLAAHGELAAEIVDKWRKAVAEDLRQRPYSPEESEYLTALGSDQTVPYGSTLLLGLVTGRWLVCVQIGDGDIVVVAPNGVASLPVPGDPSLDGTRTTSLCQANALGSFREAVQSIEQDPVLVVMAVSDGYSNAQSEEPWHPRLGSDLADLLRREGPDWVSERLPDWARLCASSAGSGDDTTIAVIINRSLARPGTETAPLEQPTRTVSEGL